MVGGRATQPDDLACMAFGSPKGRLGTAIVLLLCVPVQAIEDRDEVVGLVEGGLRGGLDGGADIGPDSVLSPGPEGVNGAHVQA